jgi:hypothetical protein
MLKKKERERLEKKNLFNDLVIFNLAEKKTNKHEK